MERLIVICLLLATVAASAPGNLIQRWVTQGRRPPWPKLVEANLEESKQALADPECCKTTIYQRSVVYIVETKEVVVPGEAPVTTTTPAPTDSTDLPIPQPFVRPPPGYTYVPETGNMYKFHEDAAPWDDAEATCQREGGHLVVVNDAVEAKAVVNILNKAGYKYTWIGLRDRRPGGEIDWRAISGEPLSTVYNRWDIGRPYKTGDYTCGYLYDDKLLYDSPCHVANFYTCEISQL